MILRACAFAITLMLATNTPAMAQEKETVLPSQNGAVTIPVDLAKSIELAALIDLDDSEADISALSAYLQANKFDIELNVDGSQQGSLPTRAQLRGTKTGTFSSEELNGIFKEVSRLTGNIPATVAWEFRQALANSMGLRKLRI